MDRLRRLWKRYTTPYVDIRDDKLSKLPRLSPVWDETTTTRVESDTAESVFSHEDSFTMFDTNSVHSPSPVRRKGNFVVPDTNSLVSAPQARDNDARRPQDQPEQYEIDFDYYERQSITCGSLESIDSLAESYWDLDETVEVSASHVTPPIVNIRSKMHQQFFAEHIRFLRIQTKPQKVEIIWGPESRGSP